MPAMLSCLQPCPVPSYPAHSSTTHPVPIIAHSHNVLQARTATCVRSITDSTRAALCATNTPLAVDYYSSWRFPSTPAGAGATDIAVTITSQTVRAAATSAFRCNGLEPACRISLNAICSKAHLSSKRLARAGMRMGASSVAAGHGMLTALCKCSILPPQKLTAGPTYTAGTYTTPTTAALSCTNLVTEAAYTFYYDTSNAITKVGAWSVAGVSGCDVTMPLSCRTDRSRGVAVCSATPWL